MESGSDLQNKNLHRFKQQEQIRKSESKNDVYFGEIEMGRWEVEPAVYGRESNRAGMRYKGEDDEEGFDFIMTFYSYVSSHGLPNSFV